MQIVRRSFGTPRGNRWLALSVALAYALLFCLLGAYIQKKGFYGDFIRPYLRGPGWLLHSFEGFMAEPEQLTIDMDWEAHNVLVQQRERALERGSLVLADDDYAPAEIEHLGKKHEVKMRLKGDGLDHLLGDKWSFRVRVRGEDTVFGMKQFSLHHPRTRNWLFEWLYHQALRREGVIALRYDFVDVTLNGKSLGIYALEEHFEKRLLEDNRRREGPIVRFSEDLLWDELMHQSHRFPGKESARVGSFLASEVDGFQTSKMLGDDVLRGQYESAVRLLEAFRRGEVRTSQAFDVEKLATYFALVDVMGGFHSLFWNNCRFYFNPVTGRLEPIGFDANAGQPIRLIAPWRRWGNNAEKANASFLAHLFDDLDFFAAYLAQLERLSEPEYLDELLAEHAEAIDDRLEILYSEFPYYEFDTEVLYENQAYVRSVLHPPKGLHAFREDVENGRLLVEVGNITPLPVVVQGFEWTTEEGTRHVAHEEEIVLPPKERGALIAYRKVSLSPPPDLAIEAGAGARLDVVYRVAGTTEVRRAMANSFPRIRGDDASEYLVHRSAPEQYPPFLSVDLDSRVITFASGQWRIGEPLVIPEGFTLACGPDTEIDLVDTAFLLSYSRLDFVGAPDRPIVVRSSDGTGQGLVVLQAGASSNLEHVHFNDLGSPALEGWTLTGAVTFYESDVQIVSCRFVDNASEDGLNVIRSHFGLEECVFSGAASDAFDADFCTGTIRKTDVFDCTNDGIDVSGGLVALQDVRIERAGDKGISAGEKSDLTVERVEVVDSFMGLVSKDRSTLVVHGARLVDCVHPLAAYQKKPEFGPATLEVRDLSLEGSSSESLLEHRSTILVEGVALPANSEGLRDVLYGAQQ